MKAIGIVGCGIMGAGIAEIAATAGLDVVVTETGQSAADQGRRRLEKGLRRPKTGQRISSADDVLSRIRVETSLDALADRDIVIEAATEQEHLKLQIFRELDRIVTRPDVILASNTSSIAIMKLGNVTQRPENVIGIHFFNPVPILPLVELVPSMMTARSVTDRSKAFVTEDLGKETIIGPDRAGFVVNALLVPFLLSAIRMLESGFASATDIDRGLVLGAAHPQGPLRLTDLIGLDTTLAVANSLYAEFKEPLYAPPPLLTRMVDAGLLGRKSGRGFFDYEDAMIAATAGAG